MKKILIYTDSIIIGKSLACSLETFQGYKIDWVLNQQVLLAKSHDFSYIVMWFAVPCNLQLIIQTIISVRKGWEGSFIVVVKTNQKRKKLEQKSLIGEAGKVLFLSTPGHHVLVEPVLIKDLLETIQKNHMFHEGWNTLCHTSVLQEIRKKIDRQTLLPVDIDLIHSFEQTLSMIDWASLLSHVDLRNAKDKLSEIRKIIKDEKQLIDKYQNVLGEMKKLIHNTNL